MVLMVKISIYFQYIILCENKDKLNPVETFLPTIHHDSPLRGQYKLLYETQKENCDAGIFLMQKYSHIRHI